MQSVALGEAGVAESSAKLDVFGSAGYVHLDGAGGFGRQLALTLAWSA